MAREDRELGESRTSVRLRRLEIHTAADRDIIARTAWWRLGPAGTCAGPIRPHRHGRKMGMGRTTAGVGQVRGCCERVVRSAPAVGLPVGRWLLEPALQKPVETLP